MAKLRDLWTSLQTTTTTESAGAFALRLLHADKDVRLFAAVTNPGNAVSLLIELPITHRPKDLSRISTRTFEAMSADFPGLPAGKCGISVVLKQPEYIDLFAMLGDEIVMALQRSTSTGDACRAVVRCIDRWRRFVEKNRPALSQEEVRGLIGELVVLSRATGKFGSAAAVDAWQGPVGSLRDFELPDFSVEVKTYQTDTGAAVRINDPQQLESNADRRTYLGVVRLAQSLIHGRSLPDFISLVESILASDVLALEVFRDKLAMMGYLASQADQYEGRFSAAPPQIYEVRDGFPRIRLDQVPAGVRDVHFSIVLNGLTPFAIETSGLLGASVGLETE